jgi:hypothetical protein
MHGEDYNLDLGELSGDSASRAHSIKHRHRKIHQDDVWLCVASKSYCLFTVTSLTHHFFTGVLESPTNPVSKDLMIIS